MPAIETTAVPPAETSGWYPRPEDDPTDTICPPTGIDELLISYGVCDESPVNEIEVIPEVSDKV